MSLISVVIPVYKAEQYLHELYNRISSTLTGQPYDFELIFVEDSGADNSWSLIQSLASSDSRVKGIQLRRNFGQQNAILCGIRQAIGEVIVTMDDDLQHPPEAIPRLVEALGEGQDVIYSSSGQEWHGFWRDFASRFTKWVLQGVMGAEQARLVNSFRAFKADLRQSFDTYRSPFINIDVLLSWATNRFGQVQIKHEKRRDGKSNYTLGKLIVHALNLLTGFSTWPLRLASIIGFVLTLFGALVLVVVLFRFFLEGRVAPGFVFTACTIAIFSGAQLFALGIIGEYLARMYYRMMERPAYVVRETTTNHALVP